MFRFLAIVLLAGGLSAETVKLQIRHTVPEAIRETSPFPPDSEKELPLATVGCNGKARLRALRYLFSMTTEAQTVFINVTVEADVEKLHEGPMAAPSITIEGEQPLTFSFEKAMADAKWESGGTFTEAWSDEKMRDPKFWKSVTLRCAADSP